MFKRPLKSFVPSVYRGVVEMDDIIRSEENVVGIARSEMYSAFANTFVLTADLSGVIMFERMLNILADEATEDLEFRRQRIINRLSMSPPFTFRFLKNRLDEIMGVGAWKAYIDFNSYTLYVEASASDQSWYSEVEFTVTRVKPCNLVFINVPLVPYSISVNEGISYSISRWWYRLGSWRLSQHPFASADGGGVVKMPSTKSVKDALLNDTAGFIASDIAAVRINDSVTITNLTVTRESDTTATVKYAVSTDMTTRITDIKLLKEDGTVLTQSAVYVPVAETVMCKHIITVKEGV